MQQTTVWLHFTYRKKARSVYNVANVALCVWSYVHVRAFAYVYVYEMYLPVYIHRNYVHICSEMRLHECVYMCIYVYLHVSQDICLYLRSLSASNHKTNRHVRIRDLHTSICVHVMRM